MRAKVVLYKNLDTYLFDFPFFFIKYIDGRIDIGNDQKMAAATGLRKVPR